MSDHLSRRNVITLAGAGLVLASCNGRGLVGEGKEGGGIVAAGTSPNWGLSPTTNPDTITGNPYKDKFKPGHIALVHVKPTEDWVMSVNYTSVVLPNSTDESRLKRAMEIFSAKTIGDGAKFDDIRKKYPDKFKDIYYFSQHNCHDFDNLDNFTFSKQTEIFFFFESTNIDFEGRRLMSVSEMTSAGSPCALNFSFLGASLVDKETTGDLEPRGQILRVRNYVMDEKLNTITYPAQAFSLNIHFTVKDADDRNPVAMIFDPDTGNGAGYEP